VQGTSVREHVLEPAVGAPAAENALGAADVGRQEFPDETDREALAEIELSFVGDLEALIRLVVDIPRQLVKIAAELGSIEESSRLHMQDCLARAGARGGHRQTRCEHSTAIDAQLASVYLHRRP